MILTQWTWKTSPRLLGVDADEHDREPVDEQYHEKWGVKFGSKNVSSHALGVTTSYAQRMNVAL